ncbi:hypothetical protein RJT34_22586 [Clitoria ternatea]|uniref:FAM50A/XAP5 C-terminal domain-containing protein n=1 Tax=Clitoria ternatea TaxID=43366 RepID=A0AAN9IKV3_CLITE
MHKKKIKGNSRLSFAEDIDNEAQEEEEDRNNNNNVRKGDNIREFLRVVQHLAHEFHEIRTISVENLLYVKEDLIIPYLQTFSWL